MAELAIEFAIEALVPIVITVCVTFATIVWNQFAKIVNQKTEFELAKLEVWEVADRVRKIYDTKEKARQEALAIVVRRLKDKGIDNITAEELEEMIENALDKLAKE